MNERKRERRREWPSDTSKTQGMRDNWKNKNIACFIFTIKPDEGFREISCSQ